jgi:hypothetical protein
MKNGTSVTFNGSAVIVRQLLLLACVAGAVIRSLCRMEHKCYPFRKFSRFNNTSSSEAFKQIRPFDLFQFKNVLTILKVNIRKYVEGG